jgi:hypothetical protein
VLPASAGPATAASIDWFPWIFAVWALGALGFLAYHLVAHGRFCARLRRQSRLSHMVAKGRVHVIETDAAQGPLAFGIWRKYVAFPKDFRERYDAVERDLALAHELAHHVRGDLIANWAALIVLAIHWFNPIAWRAFRAFRADQELACDALVLSGRAGALRHAYGRAIVKSAHGGAVSAACHLHTINDVKGRLRMLINTRRATRTQLFAGVAALSGLTLGSLALTASGTEAAARIRGHVEKAVGVDLADLAVVPQASDVPAPPAPPAAPAPAAPPKVQAVPVPPSSAAPAVAPAPPAPPAPTELTVDVKDGEPGVQVMEWTDKDGHRHVVRTVRRVRGPLTDAEREALKQAGNADGVRVRSYRFAGPDGVALMNMPDISSRNCGTDGPDAKKTVEKSVEKGKDGEKQHIVICTDRIELTAKDAEAMGKMHAEFAMRNAMMGLRMARNSVENQPDLSESQRREALAGIDKAISELEKDGTKKN